MNHAIIMGAINRALDSAEFRAVLAKMIFDAIAPDIPDEEDAVAKETVVDNVAMLQPSGLAWMYRSKLNRRPFSSEEIPQLSAYFESMIKDGIPAVTILEVLKARGRHSEGIFDFLKRVKAVMPKAKPKSQYADLEAATNAELARRSGMR